MPDAAIRSEYRGHEYDMVLGEWRYTCLLCGAEVRPGSAMDNCPKRRRTDPASLASDAVLVELRKITERLERIEELFAKVVASLPDPQKARTDAVMAKMAEAQRTGS